MADSKETVRSSLSDLLNDTEDFTEEDLESRTLTFEKTPSTLTKTERVTLEQSREKACKVMQSLLRVYLSENFISKSEYVQAKVNLDSMTLGNIMNQMEVSQRAINVLMENIELGDINPKLFDSLGKLQSTFIDLVKTQTNYIINANEEYEKLAMDKDTVVDDDSTTTAKEISSGFKTSDYKQLMRTIRTTINNKENDKNL